MKEFIKKSWKFVVTAVVALGVGVAATVTFVWAKAKRAAKKLAGNETAEVEDAE